MDSATLVAEIRARSGQTQEELARTLGVSFATVNAWERGRSEPRMTHRRRLEDLAREVGATRPTQVLLVDDDPAVLTIVGALLTAVDPGLEVTTADDGVAGLLLAGSLQPDLIVLDVVMPGLDGIEVAERVATTPGLEHTVVVLMTATPTDAITRRAADAPVLRLLTKPLSRADIVDIVAHLPGPRATTAGGTP